MTRSEAYTQGIRFFDEAEFPSNRIEGGTTTRVIFEVEAGSNLYERTDLPLFDFGREEAECDHVLARILPRVPMTEEGKPDITRLGAYELAVALKNQEYSSYPTWYFKVHHEIQSEIAEVQTEGLLKQIWALQGMAPEVFEAACARSSLTARSYLDEDGNPLRPALASLPALTSLTWPDGLPEGLAEEAAFDPKRSASTLVRIALASLHKDPYQTNPAYALQVEVPGAPGTWDYLGNVMDPVAGQMDGFGFKLEFEKTYAALHIYYVGRTFHVTEFRADEGARAYALPEIIASAKRGPATREASPEEKLLAAIMTGGPAPTPKPAAPMATNGLFN